MEPWPSRTYFAQETATWASRAVTLTSWLRRVPGWPFWTSATRFSRVQAEHQAKVDNATRALADAKERLLAVDNEEKTLEIHYSDVFRGLSPEEVANVLLMARRNGRN